MASYEAKIEKRGGELAMASVFFILIFYLSMWYIEHYDYKTASQYAILITASKQNAIKTTTTPLSSELEGQTQDYQTLFLQVQKMLQEQQKETVTGSPSSSPPTNIPPSKNHLDGDGVQNLARLPIGFYSDNQRQEQLETLYIQQIQPFIQDFKKKETTFDKYTIAHKNFKTGKLENLDIGTVTNRINIYTGKIENSLSVGTKSALPNQINKLLYWIGKRKELLCKIK